MKRYGLLVVAALLMVGTVGTVNAQSDDERMAAMEARIAALEARVNELEQGEGDTLPPDSMVMHQITVTFGFSGREGVGAEVSTSPAGDAASCVGTGDIADINQGTPVVIRDVGGQIVGQTSLGIGVWEPFETSDEWGFCDFMAEPIEIPESPFYTIEIGGRMGVSFSLDEMNADQWTIEVYSSDFVHL